MRAFAMKQMTSCEQKSYRRQEEINKLLCIQVNICNIYGEIDLKININAK